ncbi:MAG: ATP-grasp domain-containing protein [bacterium]|nr:ATP-grasp domain-containing protein [bacterium]
MKNTIGIIVREASLVNSLHYFFPKDKRIEIATFGYEEREGIHTFFLGAPNDEILSWIHKNDFHHVVFFSNQGGLLSDAQMGKELKQQGKSVVVQSLDAAGIGTNKIKMKQFFQENGFLTPSFRIAKTIAEVFSHNDIFASPYLIKAPNLSDGRKLGFIRTKADVETYFYEEAVQGPVIMEEYIEGHEVSTLVYHNFGNPLVFPVVSKPFTTYLKSDQDKLRKRLYVTPDHSISSELSHTIQQMALNLSLKMNNQYLLGIDVVIDKSGKPYIIECNARVTKTLRMSMLAADKNVVESMVNFARIPSTTPFIEAMYLVVDMSNSQDSAKLYAHLGAKPQGVVDGGVRSSHKFNMLDGESEVITSIQDEF